MSYKTPPQYQMILAASLERELQRLEQDKKYERLVFLRSQGILSMYESVAPCEVLMALEFAKTRLLGQIEQQMGEVELYSSKKPIKLSAAPAKAGETVN